MVWEYLLNLKDWTPLSQFKGSTKPSVAGVRKVGGNAYIRIQDYNRKLGHNDPDAPFITLVYWAVSVEAVERVVSGDASIVVEVGAEFGAPEQLLQGTDGTYAELKALIPPRETKVAESAIYSNKGQFLYKQIQMGRFDYCFLGTDIVPDQQPFMIVVRLQN